MSSGISARGSPVIFLMMRYLSGSEAIVGLTFSATGLYFFLADTRVVRKGKYEDNWVLLAGKVVQEYMRSDVSEHVSWKNDACWMLVSISTSELGPESSHRVTRVAPLEAESRNG